MRRIVSAVGVVLTICVSQGASGETRHVDRSVSQPGDGTPEMPFGIIQEAVDAASDGDSVIVAQGTYTERVHFRGKNIILRSTDPLDPNIVEKTIIDARHTGRVVTFSGREDESCILTGFTIRNGLAYSGAGICGGTPGNHTHTTIRNNTVTASSAYRGGGGVAYCDGLIQNNTLSENSAEYGAGLYDCNGEIERNTVADNLATAVWSDGGGLYGCGGTIRNNTITRNWAGDRGGGLAYCGGTVQNNTISANSAWEGGGLYHCDGTIENNIIAGNLAENVGGGLARCDGTIQSNTIYRNSAEDGGGGLYGCENTIRNCVIWINGKGKPLSNCSPPTYCCIGDWTSGGEGNIAYYPYFVDAANGDYHSISWSPCIDAGDPSSAFSEEPEPNGGRVNMGAYGNTREATCGSADSDRDELPDDWEMEFFGNLAQQESEDPDADLLSNIQEYHRGSNPASPGTWHVDGSVPVSGDGTLWETAFKTIQEGIDAASDGAVVVVAEGTYLENIHFHGKNITLTSTDPHGARVVESTIIDGNSAGSVVTFDGTEDEICVLSGFTIRNGKSRWGGGICGGMWTTMTGATIENNIITENRAEEDSRGYGGGLAFCGGMVRDNTISQNGAALNGGGLYQCSGTIQNNTVSANSAGDRGGGLHECYGTVENNTITANSAEYGGGLARCSRTVRNNVIAANSADEGGGLYDCDGTVQNNSIAENQADWYGGGLAYCSGTIQNNTICRNQATFSWRAWGGGLYDCDGTIENNTILANSAVSEGGGLHSCNGTIRNCIIWGNQAKDSDQLYESSDPSYSCVEDWRGGGEGNVTYCSYFVDAANGDYHLKSWSPCIDAGDPSSPFSEEPEPNGERINMGAYGNTPEATPTPADSDDDGLPDDWELKFFGDLAQEAGDDPDGDLISNIREWRSGLNPVIPPVSWYVDGSVTESGGGTSWETAFKTIREGIQAASDTEVVMVAQGIYLENIRFDGKNIVLRSANPLDPGPLAKTVIDAEGRSEAVVTFAGTERETCVLAGFTIRNGRGYSGGGIAGRGTLATIENNVITGNSTSGRGGGVASCDGMIRNNTIVGNSAGVEGGGLYGCNGMIQNCIIWGNRGWSQVSDCSVPTYCCIEGWAGGGNGNIPHYPYFVDAANGDYHLETWSPCIDAGEPASPFWREPEPSGGRVNMGAYGNTREATSKSPDTDADGLPDDWEIQWFGNLERDAAGDPDGDRIPNTTEYRYGWNPTSATETSVTNLTKNSWYPTIQVALCESDDGDEVVVYPGVYLENIDFGGRNIVLRSADPEDATIVQQTIIDGGGSGRVVTFSGAEDETCILSGFTILNGKAEHGGGIFGAGSRARIENNTITENSAPGTYGQGGGFYHCDGIIQNNTVTANSAERHGGLSHCNGMMRNNIISENAARDTGGGLAYCNGIIRNNIIRENSADSYGGGMYDCGGTIENNTVYGNSAGRGGGLDGCEGVIRNCIIWGNMAPSHSQLSASSEPSYCCIQSWQEGGVGNMSSYPYFIDVFEGDYHLHSWSPCIDAADPSSDFSNEPQPNGGRINMGAYGNTPEAASASEDTDEDLLPDDWEMLFFGDLGQAASDDPDGDGRSNLEEYRRGKTPVWLGALRHVDGSVATSGDGTSWQSAFKTIREAIHASYDRDIVVVAQGIYVENIHFHGKNIALTSTDPHDPASVANTILDGGGAGSVVTFGGTEDESCILSGFTIHNGSADYGGGICGSALGNDTSATIQNNTITGNWAGRRGGGLYRCDGITRNNMISDNSARYGGGGLYDCDGTIQNNIICGNSVTYYSYGGGLYDCDGTIQNNIICGNSATYYGRAGGLAKCDGTIHNNVVSGNSASDYGGGFYGCEGTIQNNAIYGNSADENGGGLAYCDGMVQNCIIWGNVAPDGAQVYNSSEPAYSCIQGWSGGETNISADPQFVDADGPDDDPGTYGDNDYRLAAGSPCIDAGKNEERMWEAVDLDGNPRVFYGGFSLTVDMGAYEYGSWPFEVVNAEVRTAGRLELTWNSRPGDIYIICSCTALLTAKWIQEAAIPSAGETTTWTDLNASCGRKFYRIEVE